MDKRLRLLLLLILPVGIITNILPISRVISLTIFLILYSVIYISITKLRRIVQDTDEEIETEVEEDEIEDISEKEILESDESQKYDFNDDLVRLNDSFTELKSQMDSVDSNDNMNELNTITGEFLPHIDEASNNSAAINGSITQIYTISDNLAKTTQTAFDLAKNVQDSIKFVSSKLSIAVNVTEDLDNKSKEISNILDIMSDISSMVHILSINASIESARAGIHGDGFKVVANEIRKLATNTDKSLSDIDQHVKEVQDAVVNVSSEINEAGKAIEKESEELLNVAGALQGVLLSVEIINTVSGAAKQTTDAQAESFIELKKSLDKLLNYLEYKFSDNHSILVSCRGNIKRITNEIHDIVNNFTKETS